MSRVSRWSNISLKFVRDEATGEPRSLVDFFRAPIAFGGGLLAVCHVGPISR